jgi:hypothetical protein
LQGLQNFRGGDMKQQGCQNAAHKQRYGNEGDPNEAAQHRLFSLRLSG